MTHMLWCCRRWVDALPWMGRDGWLQQPEQEWSVGGKAAGSVTEFNGLSFVRVYQAVGGAQGGW
jgi:hypothetical protein